MNRSNRCLVRAVRTYMGKEPQYATAVSSAAAAAAVAVRRRRRQQQQLQGETPAEDAGVARARDLAAAMLRVRQAKRRQPDAPTTVLPTSSSSLSSPSPLSSVNLPHTHPHHQQHQHQHQHQLLSAKAVGLRESATSFARSAYTVHISHQGRYAAYSGEDLARKAAQDWAAWGPEDRERWITAAPQGRRALRLLSNELLLHSKNVNNSTSTSSCDASGATTTTTTRGGGETGGIAAPLLPRASGMTSKYSAALVVKRKTAPGGVVAVRAAAAAAPDPFETPRAFINARLLSFAAPVGWSHQQASTTLSSSASTSTSTSTLSFRLAAVTDEVATAVQRNLWRRELSALLGPSGAAAFAGTVKRQQQQATADDDDEEGYTRESSDDAVVDVEEGRADSQGCVAPRLDAEASSSGSGGGGGSIRRRSAFPPPRVSPFTRYGSGIATATAAHQRQQQQQHRPMAADGAVYPDSLLAYCSGLGIGSPRRVYVMEKLLPHLAGGNSSSSNSNIHLNDIANNSNVSISSGRKGNDSDNEDGTAAPLGGLREVQLLTLKFSAEYDANVAELRRPPPRGGTEGNSTDNDINEAAVARYNRELLAEELGRVQEKLGQFQSQYPLLMRWLKVMNK